MSRRLGLALCLLLLPLSASGGRREAVQMLQAPQAERGWVLSVGQRRARLEATDGARQSFRVRRGERWLALSEFRDGWLASGVRVHRGRVELALAGNLGRGSRRLSPPANPRGLLRTRPTTLTSADGLEGLAWLEGTDITRLAVRVAPFNGVGFDEPETVSPSGPGSQTGLTAAVLADGTWLLAWSRFDGRDDEIFWSARLGDGSWTRPRRLAPNNQVPDITPRLLPRGNEALLAWSRLDGEYEVVTSSFGPAGWSAPRPLGVRGGLTPEFRQFADRGDYLLVRNAWPAGWTAFALDGAGRPAEFAVVAEESPRPPVLRPQAGSGLAFEWPHRPDSVRLEWESVP